MAITAAVHVANIFPVGQKERCDRLCVDLNRTIPVKNLGDLKWYGRCRYSRDRKRGTLKISQHFRGRVSEGIPCDFHTEHST